LEKSHVGGEKFGGQRFPRSADTPLAGPGIPGETGSSPTTGEILQVDGLCGLIPNGKQTGTRGEKKKKSRWGGAPAFQSAVARGTPLRGDYHHQAIRIPQGGKARHCGGREALVRLGSPACRGGMGPQVGRGEQIVGTFSSRTMGARGRWAPKIFTRIKSEVAWQTTGGPRVRPGRG